MTHWNDGNDPKAPEPPQASAESGDEVGESEPDVLLDVPDLSVDEIDLEVEDLRANVSLQADVLDLLRLHVGADVKLGRVSLTITGVQAQAQLKVRLNRVARIIDRVLTTVERNPEVLEHVARTVEPVLRDAGVAVEELGAGGRRALEDVGPGVGDTVEDVGAAVPGVGAGARKTVASAGEAVDDLAGTPGEEGGVEAEESDVDEAPENVVRRTRPSGAGSGRRRHVPPKRRRPRQA